MLVVQLPHKFPAVYGASRPTNIFSALQLVGLRCANVFLVRCPCILL
jgi:hypothetical protein